MICLFTLMLHVQEIEIEGKSEMAWNVSMLSCL